MICKTIKYHDHEGNEREDDFYFNLTQVELGKIETDPSLPGGLQASMDRAIKNQNRGEMLRIIDMVISRAYGMKLPTGDFTKRNVSGLPLYELFVNTEAYDNLLDELVSSDKDAVDQFLIGCLTKGAQEKVIAARAQQEEQEKANMKLTPVNADGSVK